MRCLAAVTSLLMASSLVAAEQPKFETIFNGTDLAGWKVPKDNIWWSVKDGVLHVQNGPNKKGSDLWTEKKYRDFVVELEFRMVKGTVDSGVFIRNMDQIQIGESGSLKVDMTASPYIPGKGYPTPARGVKQLLKPRDWNTLKIRAVGPKYTVWLNGKQVVTYTSESAQAEGPIGLQLHGNRVMEAEFRNLRAAELR